MAQNFESSQYPDGSWEEFIKKFKEFESQSYNRYKDLFEQIKKDRAFIAGEQADSIDHTLIDADEGIPIPHMGINVIQNAIRTVVNTYIPNQFKWQYTTSENTSIPNQPINKLNGQADQFLADIDNSTACVEALTNTVGTALGVLVFSTDYDIDGSIKPILYSLPDVTNVRLDPNATKLNFADAERGAIVELKSREWLEKNYGISSTIEFGEKPLIDISEHYDRKNYLPLVTYYVKSGDGVMCYKLCGDTLIEDPVILPYSYIPIVPVFGESSWTAENKQTWSGITTLMRPIQRMINYAYRQIIIRASKVPKNSWLGGKKALQGREKYWKNSDKVLNPVLVYNDYDPDEPDKKLDPPTRLSNEVQFADASALMQNALGLTNSIAGIPATGLETEVEKTATEVLTNQKVFNNNVRNYLYHLKYSLQLIGLLFAEETLKQKLFGKVKVSVVAGPDEEMKKQEARVQLNAYATFVTGDDDKRKLLVALCSVENENPYITQFAQSLQPVPTQGEMQANQMLNQANVEIKNRDQQILELQKQVNELRSQQQMQSYSMEQQMILNKQKHEFEMEKLVLESKLKGENPEVEQVKSEAEIAKAQMSVEKEALSLQKEEMKAAQAEAETVPEAVQEVI